MRTTQISITAIAVVIAAVHLRWPDLAIDAVTLTLLIAAIAPWLVPLFKSIQFPGGWKLEFQEMRKATHDQTIATIISWVQSEDVRKSRRLLYELEEAKSISSQSVDQWEEEWRQAADRVSQAFNSAAIIAKLDTKLQKTWIKPTRRAILKSWLIVTPRVKQRRKEQSDLWEEFGWLADAARNYCTPEELEAWGTQNTVEGDIQQES